jgi:hypothetical protein
MIKWIKGRKDSSHLSSGTTLILISKSNQLIVIPKWKNLWGKEKDNQPSVRVVREVTST